MRQFIVGMVFGAGLLFGFMHFHIVRGNNGLTIVPKIASSIHETYCDVRDYGVDDWMRHKSLARAILRNSRSLEPVDESIEFDLEGSFQGLVGDLIQSQPATSAGDDRLAANLGPIR